jgi:hypothetical protein
VDSEEVAVKANELAPNRFSWRRYPNQINLEHVRVALSDAKKPEWGLVNGIGNTGWGLTQTGHKWASEVEKKLSKLSLSNSRKPKSEGPRVENRRRAELGRLKGTSAWRTWNENRKELTKAEAEEVYRIDTYTEGDMRERKITRLMDLFSDNQEINAFLEALAKLLN